MFGFKKIGKGAFTNCYDMGDDNVLLESIDPQKECIAYGWFPDHKLLPSISFAPYEYNSHKNVAGDYYNYYVSPKYNKVKGYKKDLKPRDQKIYRELKDFYDGLSGDIPTNKHLCIDYLRAGVNCSKMRKSLKVLINDCIDGMSNYGSDIWFEISPRNIATDKKGNLILLDCFYMIGKLDSVRSS